MRISVFCLFLTCFIPTAPVQAAGEGDTLRQIAKTAKIRIGYREAEPPFSYQLPDGEVTGFSTDLCRAISEDIRTQLKLDKLDIEYVKATPATRFILVRSGKIDIECAATTNNSERRKMVDFSYPNFMTATQFLSRKQDNLKSLADLAGRSVTSASGTVNIEQLNAVNREKNLNISVMPTKTNEEAFELVVAGKASAFVMDGILLAALAATSENPDLYALSDETLSAPEPYGLVFRRNDPAFKAAVNESLRQIFTGPTIHGLYEKWFTQPIPPNGMNLNLPMTASLKQAYDHPSEYRD
ncbi:MULTISPECIES: amino acid ABC transporter substrate-binding protein [Agrobacterium]|uniref:amino acid ABC transporter substrate-binding protein n=1 Tax=Agrobacterium TaxID=357 RepID=UPI00122FFABD|nr:MULTISPECIES: amino acid ABC transporter substrate-binding protein [Agrobacterium]KAA3527180.1 amino acid ABC transporter substrate-binding protein [Agrobacterium tumefaciens]MBO9110301.1 amino acid ABC transporter substrate-binding protein [Agrobacterium sp. S2/73]NTA17423.1 amino acid ABC transporter substrate-binding protein [Agrobacterium tumefaciens]QXZ74235.1 amino acid ABC transporter substrate-binding protein [Agrobacterium sp. S7/73]WCK72740.1 amino acid ABC transporter substrate-b